MKNVSNSQVTDKINDFIQRKAVEFPELHLLSGKADGSEPPKQRS